MIASLLNATQALAEDFAACWVEAERDPYGREIQVTRCRLSGGDVVDYADDDSVPSVLYPMMGIDINGDCWYYRSALSQWLMLASYFDGSALLGFLPDPNNPSAIIYATDAVPRCVSEPGVVPDPRAEVWAYVNQYVHRRPDPELNPPPGGGVTGLETFVAVGIPDRHTAQLTAAGVTVDIEIEVSGVIVRWGDGSVDTFPADPEALVGYPDGISRHTYETKAPDGYDLEVAYDWTVRWRIVGQPWQPLDVPDTTTTVGYPVNEIVAVITE